MDKYLKYVGGLLLVGSVFALTWTGKIEAAQYLSLVTVALGLVGGHAIATGQTNSAAPTATEPK